MKKMIVLNLFAMALGLSAIAPQVKAQGLGDVVGVETELWCHNQLQLLRIAQQEAQIFTFSMEFGAAYERLKQGLREADASFTPGYGSALTALAVKRALSMTRSLEVQAPGAVEVRAKLNFVNSYYSHIFEVADNIDVPFPYYYGAGRGSCSGYCRHWEDNSSFEEAFNNYTRNQMETVLNTLSGVDENYVAYPIGSPRMFLAGVASAAAFMAQDLGSSPQRFRRKVACAISNLNRLNLKVAYYLSGNRSTYPNDFIAVQVVRKTAENIISDFSGCYKW